jgi:hypothetical protein
MVHFLGEEVRDHRKHFPLCGKTGGGGRKNATRDSRARDGKSGHVTLFNCFVSTHLLEVWKRQYKTRTGSLKGWVAAWKKEVEDKLLLVFHGEELSFLDPYRYGQSADLENYAIFGRIETEPFLVKKFRLAGDIAPFRESILMVLFGLLGIAPTEPELSDCGKWLLYKKVDSVALAVPMHSFARNFEPHISIVRIPGPVIHSLTGSEWNREETDQAPILRHFLEEFRTIPDRGHWSDFKTRDFKLS